MNLLLLLSALFGALTGVTGGPRVTMPAEQVAVVRRVAAVAVAPHRVVLPAVHAADLLTARYQPAALVRFVFAETPRYASRRRE